MRHDLAAAYLRDIARTYRNYKTLGEKALAQVPDEHLHTQIDSGSNSVAVTMRHMAGNLRSRFTDFLTSDGEKPTRNRDAEFDERPASRAELVADWEAGWTIALASIDALAPEDLTRTVTVRSEPFLVVEALNRLATHAAYHVGQIVYLARHFAGDKWTSLSIPKGKSAEHSVGTFKQAIVPPQNPGGRT